jgi:hypothetical protein
MTSIGATLLAALQIGATGSRPFVERSVHELAVLRSGITVSAWMTEHPGDTFVLFGRDSVRENHDSWCGRAGNAERLSDGVRMVRYAYFYPPPPQPSQVLPDGGEPTLIQRQCTLGTIWIQSGGADSAEGNALAASLRAALTQRYGPVTASPDVFFLRVPIDSQRRLLSRTAGAEAMLLGLHFFGAAAWRTPGRWQADSTVLVSAFDRGGLGRRAVGRVLAFAYLPIAELGSFRRVTESEALYERRTATLAATAAHLAGMDTAKVDRLFALYTAAESATFGRHPARPAELDSAVLVALKDWITSARELPPARRAGALLAADQITGSGAMLYVRSQAEDSTRLALERVGATFTRDELSGGYNYTHNWLDEALRLDPSGPVGKLATLALLRNGFNETGMCGGGSEAFRRVIATGEQLLADALDTATAAEVHRLVGDAYADIVALAAGGGSGYADSAAYLGEAPAARSSAIVHYRQALALDHVSQEARAAWLEAWRLIAGLPPTRTHFFCVYD